MLEEHGHLFVSETDTEVLSHLIEAAFDGSLEDAVMEALHQVEGAYAIGVLCSRDPDKIVAARKAVRSSSASAVRRVLHRERCLGDSGAHARSRVPRGR